MDTPGVGPPQRLVLVLFPHIVQFLSQALYGVRYAVGLGGQSNTFEPPGGVCSGFVVVSLGDQGLGRCICLPWRRRRSVGHQRSSDAYRHHNPTLNETALLNSSYGRAQFETAFNTFADIQYVHNSSWVGALNSPAVKIFSSSLSKGDREAFHHLLVKQREMTKSEFEAFSRYPTTRAWLRCASSSPRGNFTAFTLCRSDTSSYSPDQDLIAPDDAKRRGAVRLAQTCFKLAVEFSMTSMGIHVATIIAAALKASIAVFRLFAIGFLALMAAWTSAGCVAYSAIAVYRLDHI
ncbi:hypothetical protein CVIRNUC_003325 [Coccomyxa viridis]|uniref:Uncharacterized protein n=1 Tax=Coccomyxa viridis TaxID=1274662 RepID=A0AAV1I1C0_9CHLO|nr:hypothetical protein CVIRNUC_003325 [Coccomyxa viridis]